MKQLYLVPDIQDMEHSIQLAREYGCAFEYNDFYAPAVLDDPKKQQEIISLYRKYRRDFSGDTMHGAFLDVTIPGSGKYPFCAYASPWRSQRRWD